MWRRKMNEKMRGINIQEKASMCGKCKMWLVMVVFALISTAMLSSVNIHAASAEENQMADIETNYVTAVENTQEQITVNIPVKLKITGNSQQNETFSFLLKQNDEQSPMPKISKVQITGTKKDAFQIQYEKPGVYRYTISQVAGDGKNWIYDQSEYSLEVYIMRNEQTDRLQSLIVAYNDEINELNSTIKGLKKSIITFSDEILVQNFGLYEPRYSFLNADSYKAELTNIRNMQKAMIKDGSAVSGSADWQVNGSVVRGRKMIKDMQKLLLRAFNSECDEIINKIKYNNYNSSVKKMERSFNAIAKLGVTMAISITSDYYDLKIQELQLSLEYQIQKQREKEEKAELRAQQREEARLQKELKEQRKNIDKERKHYEQALSVYFY